MWKRQNTDVRAEIVLDEHLSFFMFRTCKSRCGTWDGWPEVRLSCIIISVFISGCWSRFRKLEAVIASKEASAQCWVKAPPWWWRDPFFRSTVCHLSHNIRVWWRWECWHADQERLINDSARQMLPELAPQSSDTLVTAWNHINIITLTQKWISTELCLVPEWTRPTNTRPKVEIFMSSGLVVSNLLPAGTGSSGLLLECVPLEH